MGKEKLLIEKEISMLCVSDYPPHHPPKKENTHQNQIYIDVYQLEGKPLSPLKQMHATLPVSGEATLMPGLRKEQHWLSWGESPPARWAVRREERASWV